MSPSLLVIILEENLTAQNNYHLGGLLTQLPVVYPILYGGRETYPSPRVFRSFRYEGVKAGAQIGLLTQVRLYVIDSR